ncbi:DUF7471 family protein [Natrialba asiatica]|uniref:Uncharacterized protein n=1 Tax=Natrialba asiatica (strain ATCC 700177 / DSM 12278 / JCM 9576 / FERM P-10747 / NBRC 102637 / 172P1) TaxID=29540 RepID=M0B045_NATA1|nr:hypothetical protein [Natrialba asiatica]ELZ03039.1 hypothetical protein C481_06167 [Natrialba asiatica DSM 12278]
MDYTTPFDIGWVDPEFAPVLLAMICLAVVGTTALLGVGLVAYLQRRSSRYLLITVVLGLLVGRSIIGLGTVFGLVPMTIHHLVGHGVDFSIAALVLYIVYRSRSASRNRYAGSEGGDDGIEGEHVKE